MTRSTKGELAFARSGSERQKPSFRFEWVRRAKLSGAFQVATDTVENDSVRLGVASLSKAHTRDRAPTASVPIAHGCNCPPCTSSPSFLCSTRRAQVGTAIQQSCLGLRAPNLAALGSTTIACSTIPLGPPADRGGFPPTVCKRQPWAQPRVLPFSVAPCARARVQMLARARVICGFAGANHVPSLQLVLFPHLKKHHVQLEIVVGP